MRATTQGLVLAFLGVVLVRLAVGGDYLSFVTPWMRWPIIVSGALLLLIALRPALGLTERAGDDADGHGHDGHGHGEGVPAVTWLLLLPGLVVFTVSPPALGAYLAERRADDVPSVSPTSTFSPLPAGNPADVELEEFIWRAQVDEGVTLVGRTVRVSGFVTLDKDGGWYVTRMSISCCAADATVARVQVEEAEAPERNSWVEVVGSWSEGTGTDRREVPQLVATDVTPIDAPDQTYQ